MGESKNNLKFNDLIKKDPIFKSNASEVFLYTKKTDQETKIVGKKLKLDDEDLKRCFEDEVEILETLPEHENFVKYLGHEVVERERSGQCTVIRGYVFMEYCDGDLMKLFHGHPNKRKFSWSQLQSIAIQMAKGIHFLHQNNLVHRDLKPENVLYIGKDLQGLEDIRIKITDFGLSKHLFDDGSQSVSLIGTEPFFSPEQMKAKENWEKLTEKERDEKRKRGRFRYKSSLPKASDVFCLANIFYWLKFNQVPFSRAELLDDDYTADKLELLVNNSTDESEAEFKDLCQKMLRKNEKERISMEDVLNHPALNMG